MPSSSSDHDGTPNRRRRSGGSRGRAKVSITTAAADHAPTTTNNSHSDSHSHNHSEAVLTPASASAASSSVASDLRRVRTVRTGDTTVVPTGSRSDNTTGSTAHPTGGSSNDEGPPSSSPSYQSMGAGTQATATAGGLLYSALGTLQEWTNDLANDLMVAAVDNHNSNSNSNDANANGSSSSGGRNADQNGSNGTGDGIQSNNDNATNDKKKKKTSSSPGRKLRAAVVRSLSPSSRRGNAKNIAQQSQSQPQPQSLRVTGTNPCGPALRQAMDEFVAQATAVEGAASNNATNHNTAHAKPMSKMRQKLAQSTTTKSGGTTTNKSTNSRAVSVGGGDSTVVARTAHTPRKDKANQQEQTKKANAATNGNATGTGTGTETAANKPHIIGPVQFLQHMMSTNCMGGANLAQLGFGGGGGASDDDDDDGSSYDDSSSEEDGSDGSDTTGHSSGRNHRRRRQPKHSGSGGGRRRAQQQRRSGSGSRGKGRGRGQRGSSTLSGRPEDIPEGDEDEGSSTGTGAEEEEDLDVIGRRPGAGVVRDKGGGTPRQHNRKSAASHAGTCSGDGSDWRRFSTQLIDHGFPLIWHRVHDSKLQMEPTDIATFLMLDEESPDPCLTWDIYDDATGRSKKVVARGSIPLFEIASVETAEAKHLQAYPFAMPSHSFFVALRNGGVILFEAKDKEQREVFVRGLRWVVARLSFNLIVGNGSICTELGLIGGDALDDEDVDSTMDDVTNRLVDVSVQAVRANSMMKA